MVDMEAVQNCIIAGEFPSSIIENTKKKAAKVQTQKCTKCFWMKKKKKTYLEKSSHQPLQKTRNGNSMATVYSTMIWQDTRIEFVSSHNTARQLQQETLTPHHNQNRQSNIAWKRLDSLSEKMQNSREI